MAEYLETLMRLVDQYADNFFYGPLDSKYYFEEQQASKKYSKVDGVSTKIIISSVIFLSDLVNLIHKQTDVYRDYSTKRV